MYVHLENANLRKISKRQIGNTNKLDMYQNPFDELCIGKYF